jgi:hypothetical protein
MNSSYKNIFRKTSQVFKTCEVYRETSIGDVEMLNGDRGNDTMSKGNDTMPYFTQDS